MPWLSSTSIRNCPVVRQKPALSTPKHMLNTPTSDTTNGVIGSLTGGVLAVLDNLVFSERFLVATLLDGFTVVGRWPKIWDMFNGSYLSNVTLDEKKVV